MTSAEQNEMSSRFLLGKLSEDETSELEERFFTDSSTFDDLLIAENSLIDDYVLGRLSDADRTLFERRLLLSRRQVERTRLARALIDYASRQPREINERSVGWFAAVRSSMSLRPWLIGSAAAALLLVGVVLFWQSSNVPPIPDQAVVTTPAPDHDGAVVAPPRPSPQPSAELPDQVKPRSESHPAGTAKATRPETKPLIATIMLPLTSTRDLTTRTVHAVAPGASVVSLQIPVDPAFGEFRSYFAVLETVEGRQIWRGPVTKRKGIISASVPAARVRSGDYIITLRGSRNNSFETVGEYAFSVDRR